MRHTKTEIKSGGLEMSKRNEFMDGRNEGMLYAYNFARKNGLDELEKEIKFRGLTKLPVNVNRKEVNEVVEKIKQDVIYSLIVIFAETVHDEFGFGSKRIEKLIQRFNQKAKCIGDYVTLSDMVNNLKEEYGIDVSDYKGK